MTRGVRWSVFSSAILVALLALAGCSHYMMAEREPWRRERRACVPEFGRGEGVAGAVADFVDRRPGCLRHLLSAACLRTRRQRTARLQRRLPDPAGSIPDAAPPNGAMPQHWPIAQPGTIQANPLPALQSTTSPYGAPPTQTYSPPPIAAPGQPQYSQPPYGVPTPGAPLSLYAPGVSEPAEQDGDAPHGASSYPPNYAPGSPPASANEPPPLPPLGPPRDPLVTASAGPVEVKPPATLACPIRLRARSMDQRRRAAGGRTLVSPAHRRDQTDLRLFLPRHERRSECPHFRTRLRQCARHCRIHAGRRPQGVGAIWLAWHAGGAGISATMCSRPRAMNSPPCWHRAPTSIITITFTST